MDYSIDINALIIVGAIVCAVIAFVLGLWLGTNVKRSLDQVGDGADGDTEPTRDKIELTPEQLADDFEKFNRLYSVRASDDKTPENDTEGR